MKAALRVLLKLREEDRKQLEESVSINFEHTLCPWIDRLKRTRLDSEQKSCVEMIEANLGDVTASFVARICSTSSGLTPAEMQVAQLVKTGKTSKEIADLLGVSKQCVDFHRNNLRKKLGLNNQKVNLRSYLCSLSQ